jgi:hypothetical protein
MNLDGQMRISQEKERRSQCESLKERIREGVTGSCMGSWVD